MITIQTIIEARRGCGYKKPGGTYLIGGKNPAPCCKLPFPITCCGHIKFSRGFTWINSDLFEGAAKFIAEAGAIGISKRIGIVPKDCVPGSTWIALAHKKGIIKDVEIGAEGSKPGNTSFVLVPAIFMGEQIKIPGL